MAARETAEAALARWARVELLQEEYRNFGTFLEEAMALLGFPTSPVQYDIGNFLADGPEYLMVQAQRGQAKSTITAIFAVWTLIMNPAARILIISAGGTQANEISTLIVRLIMGMDELEDMRPDAANGDRTSVEAFDLHYSLKGIDKSPSVACVGVTGNLQGKRADLLIADDIESAKNSLTALMREQLMNLTRDFTSISMGRIVYLGTPQSQESTYNTLPGRGFAVRIWPGRFPTPDQLANYGDMLAPYIVRRLAANPALAFGGGLLKDQGQPIDPTFLGEMVLQKKERDQGPAYFQLQHMLNTKLADALRFPLKPENLIAMKINVGGYLPMTVARGFGSTALVPFSVHTFAFQMASPVIPEREPGVPMDVAKLQGTVAYVDPAGGGKNGDETGYAVTGFLNSNIYLLSAGGFAGGYGIPTMEALARRLMVWSPQRIIIEKNMGYGAFREVWTPVLSRICKEMGVPMPALEDDMVTGQKELRIIDTLEPIIARGALIVNTSAVEQDRDDADKHEPAKRIVYSLFHQMAKITRERGALGHDDRLDALEGACRYWVKYIAIDQEEAVRKARQREALEALKDPLGRLRHQAPSRRGGSMFDRYRR